MKSGNWRRVCILMVLTIVALSLSAGAAFAQRPGDGSRPPNASPSSGSQSADADMDALIASGAIAGTYGVERPYVTHAGPQREHDIHGKWVVYTDYGTEPNGAIKLYSRGSSPNVVTTIAGGAATQFWPHVSGNRVVWMDNRYGSWDVFWYDIAANKVWQLTGSADHEMYADVWGDWVVYERTVGGPAQDSEIMLYNFKTKVTKRLTDNTGPDYYPRVEDGAVTWTTHDGSDWEIIWYDIATGTRRTMTNNTSDDTMPVVSANHLAWTNYDGGAADYDVKYIKYIDAGGTSATFTFPDLGDEFDPALQGETLVFTRDSGANDHIKIYNAGSGWYHTLSATTSNQNHAAVWGNIVVVEDDRNGNDDLFAVEIARPVLAFSLSTPAYGGASRATGTLKRADGTPLAGRAIKLFHTGYSGVYQYYFDWSGGSPSVSPITVTTNSSGAFSAWLPVYSSRFYVQALFDGAEQDAWYAPSSVRVVRPRVSLSKPIGKKSVSNTKSYTYYGYLRPKHAAGSQRVWIKCYRKSGGKYRLKKTYVANLSDYSTYTKYSKKIKLSREGKWRIKAVYKTSYTNSETNSSYKYITSY